METIIIIVVGVLLAALVIFLLTINFFTNRIIYPYKSNYKEIEADLKKRLNYSKEEFESLLSIPYEEFSIRSIYGYDIYGRLFRKDKSSKCIILLHREGRNLIASYKFLKMYLKEGYSVIMFDARYHGNSGGHNYTYGYFERWDLKTVADYAHKTLGKNLLIGTHGESGGASTALLNLKTDRRINFCISDSSFTDLLEVMRVLEKKFLHSSSKKILLLINQIIKRRAGFSIVNVSPLTEIEALEVPVLFIHSELDNIVPNKMSKTLKSFKSGYSKLFIGKGSHHLLSYYEHTKEYEDFVRSFLRDMEKRFDSHGKTY